MKKSKLFNAPIPGENLTVDNRGYPWHRPPQYTDFDDAYEFFVDNVFGNGERISAAISMANNGINAVAITQNMMLQAVGSGRISPDMSLLIAGPFYKTLIRIFDQFDAKYLTGFDTEEEIREFVNYLQSNERFAGKSLKAKKLSQKQLDEMEQITEEVKADIPKGGLMGAPEGTDTVEIPSDSTGKGLVPEEATAEGDK